MKDSLYHSLLRISSLTLALVLLFESGLLSPVTKELAHETNSYIASVISVGASVQPTELSQMTAELTKQKTELDKREAALKEREIAVNLNTDSNDSSDYVTYIMSVTLFILLVLIVVNYTLDYMHRNPISRIKNEQAT